jgi:uncharacterized protein with GYD domain
MEDRPRGGKAIVIGIGVLELRARIEAFGRSDGRARDNKKERVSCCGFPSPRKTELSDHDGVIPPVRTPRGGALSSAPGSRTKREERHMTTFVTLYNFTDQGLHTIKDTVKRAEAAKAEAAKVGVTIKDILWLQGHYDIVAIIETSDEAAATAFSIGMLKAGNLRGQTLRAFTAKEMAEILAKVA